MSLDSDTRSARTRESSSSSADPAPEFDEPVPDDSQQVARGADVLRNAIVPSYLTAMLPGDMTPAGCREYLDQIVREASAETDPLARMALEQLSIAHFRIVALQLAASQAKSAQAAAAFTGAAVKLMAEHRRLTTALHERRADAQPKKKPRFGTIG